MVSISLHCLAVTSRQALSRQGNQSCIVMPAENVSSVEDMPDSSSHGGDCQAAECKSAHALHAATEALLSVLLEPTGLSVFCGVLLAF